MITIHRSTFYLFNLRYHTRVVLQLSMRHYLPHSYKRKGIDWVSNSVVVRESLRLEEQLAIWEDVYLNTRCSSPFLSPHWIEGWLRNISSPLLTALFYCGNHIKGIALIGTNTQRVLGLKINNAYLNQAGTETEDQAWIEYNDLLCPEKFRTEFFELLVSELRKRRFHRFKTSMKTNSYLQFSKSQYIAHTDVLITKGFTTSLDVFTQYPSKIMSKNSRTQIKRSQKLLKLEFGDIDILKCSTPTEILEGLKELAELHRLRWGSTENGSGFDNSIFMEHQKSILLTKPHFAELIKCVAGNKTIGFSINLILSETVFFYCSGINYFRNDNKVKAGYVMHHEIMNYYANRGFKTYDFLGGNSRYKSSLSNREVSFFTETFIFNNLTGKVLSTYKKIRHCLSKPSPDFPQQ